MALKSSERFSNRVENYSRFRPNYPPELLSFIKSHLRLNSDSIIADIGSGTGISSELFLKEGYTVYAVEPNDKMRAFAEKALSSYSRFISVGATSSETSLPKSSVDLIVAAQAFHWFEPESTKKEFRRILKPKGVVALIWNDRRTEGSPFSVAYEKLIHDFALDYFQVNHKNIDEHRLSHFLGLYELKVFENHQDLDFQALLGRLTSSSYMPSEDNPQFPQMEKSLKDLFNKFQQQGLVRIEYETKLYYSSEQF